MIEEVRRLFSQGRGRVPQVPEGQRGNGISSASRGWAARPMNKLMDLIRELPGFIRLRADRSVYGHAKARVRDPRLRMALSFHPLFIGGDPTHVTSMYILVSHLEKEFGVHYAMGGVQAMADAMVRVIEDQGGQVRQGAEVDEILTRNGAATGVRLTDGQEMAAEIVVSNADPGHTYSHLLRRTPRKRWTDKRLGRARWSMGLFVWYFGTKGTRGKWSDVGHHTILNGPRYRGLLHDIFMRKHLADDMSVYLHRPSVTDPSAAPEGDDTFYALSPVPNLHGTDAVDWAEKAEDYRQNLARVLDENLIPGFEADLSASELFTPRHLRVALPQPPWRGLQPGAAHLPERVVQAAQHLGGGAQPLSCRCGHPSGRWHPLGRDLVRSADEAGAGRPAPLRP